MALLTFRKKTTLTANEGCKTPIPTFLTNLLKLAILVLCKGVICYFEKPKIFFSYFAVSPALYRAGRLAPGYKAGGDDSISDRCPQDKIRDGIVTAILFSCNCSSSG